MKNILKSGLSLVLALTIILSSAIVGLGEIDFSGLFAIKAEAANSGTCGENLTWTLDDNGTLTISGTGAMKDYWAGSRPSWSKVTSLVIKNGVTTIGNYAFYNCGSLETLSLPDSVKSIGDSAFAYCRSLKVITIPDSVTYIESSSFYGTDYYYDINNWEKGFLYISNHLVDVNNQNSGDCEIKEGIKTIAGSAFSYCDEITSLKIPDSVVSIGEFAFRDCSGLETITIPDSVTSIGRNAFEGCAGLKNVNLSNNIECLDYCTFQYCTNLESIVIPDGVTSISGYVFEGCTKLESITLPDSVTDIGDSVFNDTAYYNNSNNWVNGILYISDYLIDVKYPIIGHCDIKDGTKKIVDYAFSDCTELTSVAIPDSVTGIGKYAFSNCKKLTTVTIPGNVSSIGKYAFVDCVNLASVTLSEGITSIGEGALKNCDLLYSITIPDSVTTIEDFALGYDNGTVQIKDFVVCGTPGTIAETYANKNGFLFVDAQHTHVAAEWKTIKEPTIDTSGVKIKECSVCKTALETEVIPQLTPAAPKVSISTSTNSVLLEWKKVTGADEYIVYRREYDPKAKKWSGWTRIEDGLTETSEYDNYYYIESYDENHYYDYSAKSGVYYIYTVRAANEAGRGPYVSTEKVYFLAAPKITSLEHDCNNITIKWNKVNGTKAYIVYRATVHNYGNGWQKIGTTKGTSYVDKSAEVGEHYRYTVRSYNGSYISWFYDNKEITMLTTPKLKSVSCSKDGATIKWNKVKGADSYYVYRREYDAKTKKWSGWTRINSYTNNTSYVDKTAKSGKYYIYTVKARAGAWNHDDYSSYDKTGLKIYFLATPSMKSATSTKSGVKLQWSKISGASGYKIYRKTGNNPWGEAIATVKGNSTVTYVDKTAKKGVTYTYTVRAYNGNTKSGYIAAGKTLKDKY